MSTMSLRVKPAWLVGLALLVAAGLALRLAFALAAFSPANQPIGYVAQDEMSNYNLRSGNEVLFRGQYEREFWSGTVLAYPIDAQGNLTGGTAWWSGGDASEMISQQNPDTERLIATMKDDGTAVAFRLANLSPTQQGYLSSDTVVNYLRGDRTNEVQMSGGTLRQRASALGDIVHSRPYYVADSTNPTLFVGGNDGMLHAINAAQGIEGGKERWAYVPSMLLPKMKNLSSTTYTHDYYVDGQINVATILSDSKRVLVGALGAGGKGLYALDITGSAGLTATTEAGVAAKAMWELTPTKLNYADPAAANAFVNLGYTYGTLTLAKVGGVDAVIFGNGYNDGVGSYSGCTHGTPNYANCGGNYAAYLYVINANTGQLIKRFKAGADGTAASPNGLSTPVAIDTDGDGSVDRVYAGDLNGTMWKFNLNDASDSTATLLLATTGGQAITATPGVAIHPEGGYMVSFGTGKMLVTADATDSTVHYVYGIWDGAPVTNTTMVTQTLSERNYTLGGVTTRVRRSTSLAPVWTAGGDKGWKVALPAGERVIGEGSFTENGRFYFNGFNPTVSTTIPDTTSIVKGENWLMELDYLTGGSKNQPFLDLSADVKLNNDDRIKYITGDTLPSGAAVGDPILTTDGIPVGKFISIGVLSQPILVQLVTLNDTLFNQNPDITLPVSNVDRGVEGGHFDVEIYYGSSAGGSGATATLTVGSGTSTATGQTSPFPATLGAITVNGITVVPALTVSDLPNGTGNYANASKIKSKVVGGFTATVSNNVVTLKAPVGASFNGATIAIADGTSQTLVPAVAAVAGQPAVTAVAAVRPTGLVTFSGTNSGSDDFRINDTLDNGQSVRVGGSNAEGSEIQIGAGKNAAQAAAALVAEMGTGNTYKAYIGGNAITPICAAQTSNVVCIVDTSTNNNGSNNGRTISLGAPKNSTGTTNITWTTTATAGGVTAVAGSAEVVAVAAVPQSGWTNLKPALTVTTFSGGSDGTVTGDTCNSGTTICKFKQHVHEYDDIYDRTGVNFLDASDSTFDLQKAIPSTSTPFKVLAQNQYLSPAVKLHIGNPAYLFDVDTGYIQLKNYQTSSTLDLATVTTYTRATIGSLAFNLPPNAFSNLDWWGGVNGLPADVRDGVHPTEYFCATYSASATRDGNMYQPVNPPSTVTASGNGTKGYSSSTTQNTATGVRHNGALTIQLVRDTTPNSAIELSVPGRPEYGWRVMASQYSTYVLAEYSMFHHTKHLGVCYGDTGWSKTPASDTRVCGTSDSSTTKKCAVSASSAGGTDPKIGNLGGGSDVVSTTTTTVGDVTTTVILYSNALRATIVRTTRSDGSIEIVTTDTSGTVTREVIANKAGAVKSGGDERGLQSRTGRISWRELVAP